MWSDLLLSQPIVAFHLSDWKVIVQLIRNCKYQKQVMSCNQRYCAMIINEDKQVVALRLH